MPMQIKNGARSFLRGASAQPKRAGCGESDHQARTNDLRHERDGMRVSDDSSSFSLRKSGNTEKDKQGALEAHFAAAGRTTLEENAHRRRSACADGDGIDAVSERTLASVEERSTRD